MMKSITWINTIFFLIMIFVNTIANMMPLGGNTTGQVSEKYPNLFTPAPYTFMIWGIIYAFMLLFIVVQFIPDKKAFDAYYVSNTIGIWFVVSCIFNIAWIISWHYDYILVSLLVIIGLLVSLIVISTKINHADFSGWRKLVPVGFQIYLGWICAATIANVSVYLKKIEWSGFRLSDQFWTVMVLIVGAVIGIVIGLSQMQPYSTIAILWAYIGILVKHVGTKGYNMAYKPIVATLIICMVVMLLLIRTFILLRAKNT